MKSLVIVLHVFSQTGQPLPSSSSKGKEKRLRRAPWRVLTVMTPEVQAPSRAASPAPVSSTSPHSVGPAVQQHPQPPSPCAEPLWWPWLLSGRASGWWRFVCFRKSEMPIFPTAHSRAGQDQSYWGCTSTNSKTRAKEPPTLPVGQRSPSHPQPHSSKCQDATDWIDAEDFPFLWFFCLFWVYTIIKESLVLAGNLKNKTKQRNHPPLAYSSSIKTWQSFLSTLGVGMEGWELHSKKRWKGWGCSF